MAGPCEYLSPDGLVLLQRRADVIPATYEMPEKLPAFMTDTKRDNFGILEGRLVCVDYSLTNITPALTLRKAHWS